MSALFFLPALRIELDSTPLTPLAGAALEEVRIQQRLSCPSLCELSFGDISDSLFSGPFSSGTLSSGPQTLIQELSLGRELRVQMTPETAPLFCGAIAAVDYLYKPGGSRQIRVRAYDDLQRLRASCSARAYVEVTPADLARELVANRGWAVQAADPGPLWPRLIQRNQSDLDFLAEIAARSGLYISLQGSELQLFPLAGDDSSEVALRLGESLLEVHLAVAPSGSAGTVTVASWDLLRAEPISGQATQARTGRRVDLPSPHMGAPQGNRTLTHWLSSDLSQAEAFAQAELDHQAAGAITAWGVAEGHPHLRPGAAIALQGVAVSLEGRYVLTAVNHSITPQQGYLCEFSTVPPPRRPPASPGIPYSLVLGQVTQLDDPESRGRVQVSLPTCADAETAWLPVLAAGAGVQKGLVALPDVGDRVLVLVPDQNWAEGAIIGAFHGSDADLDWGIAGGRRKRQYWRSAGGQQILYDDERQLLRLENGQGSYIELQPDQVSIHAATDLRVEAPGRRIEIAAKTVDFVRQES